MLESSILFAVLAGVVVLLLLILFFRIPAFIALLLASITVGLTAGMEPSVLLTSMQTGMGSTLGYVAMVVGLGAMFGAILEQSGGAEALASKMLSVFGDKNAHWAMMLTGFFVAIPVFFDVAFIILVPMVYALQRRTGKSLLLYAIPLLAGLAITHAYIPPTPGPIAVADFFGADLGQVIWFGFLTGIPTAIVSGPVFAKYIASKIHLTAPPIDIKTDLHKNLPNVWLVITIITIPIVLILCNTVLTSDLFEPNTIPDRVKYWATLLGHPFSALILANLIAWYDLGIRGGYKKEQLLEMTTKSMQAAGVIILLTGAGGVFKQILVDTGAGKMLAEVFAEMGFSLLFFAFLSAVLVRILQGSATVAMITAAGLTAPLLLPEHTMSFKALLVIAIASGGSILSHVNDSGFWLVGKYLGMDEKQTFRSWSMMTTILALVGFSVVLVLSLFV